MYCISLLRKTCKHDNANQNQKSHIVELEEMVMILKAIIALRKISLHNDANKVRTSDAHFVEKDRSFLSIYFPI